MGTATKRTRPQVTANTEKAEEGIAAVAPRRRRRWLICLLSAAVLVWLLPGIVAHTPMVTWILHAATSKLDGSVGVRSASLGWFSPIALSGIEVRDARGEPVIEAEEARSEKSLLAILWNRSSLGKFTVDKPKAAIEVRRDGSNLEDLLAGYLAPSDEPSKPVGFEVEVVDGAVTLTDQETRQSWQIDKLQVGLGMSADPEEPLCFQCSAAIDDAQQPGRLESRLSVRMPQREQARRPSHPAGATRRDAPRARPERQAI